MNIVIAIALLALLFAHIGKKNSAQPPNSAGKRDDPDWIDELELIDAALDDF